MMTSLSVGVDRLRGSGVEGQLSGLLMDESFVFGIVSSSASSTVVLVFGALYAASVTTVVH